MRNVRLRELTRVEKVRRRVAAALPFGRAARISTRTKQPLEQRVLTIRRPAMRDRRPTLTRSFRRAGFELFFRLERGRASRCGPLPEQTLTVSRPLARACLTEVA